MDDTEFEEIYGGYDPQHCHFSRAIRLGCAGCSRSQRVLIAEREKISCLSRPGHARCGKILQTLVEKAVFALGVTHAGQELSHGKWVRLECGGLEALARLSGTALPDDVDGSLQRLEQAPGGLDAIPYGEVVRSISRYPRRGRRHSDLPD
ncbi:hypothetical protein [Thioalkalivibrio sp.]|uniref:hypothetical protein n=1 Tax=Thioalkalivibrio sp. TaxID=2093813 RepID=UPI0035631AB3